MLEMHGWNVNLSDFISMAREHRWSEMGRLVSDDMLEAYAVIAKPADLPAALKKRFGGQVNRIQIDETWFDGPVGRRYRVARGRDQEDLVGRNEQGRQQV